MRKAFLLIFTFLSLSVRAEEYKHHWQFGIGPSSVSNVNSNDIAASWRFGFGWNVDANYEMAVIADWAISYNNTDMHYFTAKLASDYNFSEENTTPFVTADLGYGSVHAHYDCANFTCQSPDDDAGGISLGVGGGYKFWRSNYVQLGLLGRVDAVFSNTRYGTPTKYSLQLVSYF